MANDEEPQAAPSGSSSHDLRGRPKLDVAEIRLLWMHDYCDGPLSGALVYRGILYWFELCGGSDDKTHYVVLELVGGEIEEEQRWQSLFVDDVGDDWSVNAKFYDAYGRRPPVDHSRNPVLGWFEL